MDVYNIDVCVALDIILTRELFSTRNEVKVFSTGLTSIYAIKDRSITILQCGNRQLDKKLRTRNDLAFLYFTS